VSSTAPAQRLGMGRPVPRSAAHGEQWTIRSGPQVATIVQRGAAIRSYALNGVPVVDSFGDEEVPVAFHGAVLAPWPNRVRDGRWQWQSTEQQLAITEVATFTALHGLLVWVPWQLVEHAPDSVALCARLLPQAGYPFAVEVLVTWSVSDRGLSCVFGARNLGNTSAPFGIAAHPYLVVQDCTVDELMLTVPARSWVESDERLLPVARHAATEAMDFRVGRQLGGVSLDTAFTDLDRDAHGFSEVTLRGPTSALTVWADEQFGWWQLYTSDYFGSDDLRYRRAVAIEPMTCGPDALNTGEDILLLEPGQSWRGCWGIRATGPNPT
jgi:aldose 1-epimerase